MKQDWFGKEMPPWVFPEEMRALEAGAAEKGFPGEALMEEAARGLAEVVAQIQREPGVAVVFAGKGHNGGDGWLLASRLVAGGWKVQVRCEKNPESLRPLTRQMRARFEALAPVPGPGSGGTEAEVCRRMCAEVVETWEAALPPGRGRLLLVDALLGTGTRGALNGSLREAADVMNGLREREHAWTLAVDQPSGLGTGGSVVVADHTVCLGWPGRDLLVQESDRWVGRLWHVPLSGIELPDFAVDRDRLVTGATLRRRLPGPSFFNKHKGQSGRIGILAGSVGLTGAARLSATAASLLGGGLITLFSGPKAYPVLAASCGPEIMVKPVHSAQEVREFQLDALAVGPGLGAAPLPGLASLLVDDPRPMVVDADGLNHLATLPDWRAGTARFAGPRILTPHPGELARLIGNWKRELAEQPRQVQAQAISEAFGVTVLAKSARSVITSPGTPAIWNSTGHPLMARGGMGDVLTGFLATLAGQGWDLAEAAVLGSWILGRGAEFCSASQGGSHETGVASEVMRAAAGAALTELRHARPGSGAGPC